MRFRSAASIVLSGSIAVAALGCATFTDQGAMFKESQRRYTSLMRYTDFDSARAFVAPDSKADFKRTTVALRDIRFTDYEIQEIETNGKVGTVTVQYSGYRASSPTVVTLSEEQHWELAGNAWVVRPTLAENPQ
jgi:hypothetical protein